MNHPTSEIQSVNSNDTIKYITSNYKDLVRANLHRASEEVVEDCLSKIISYLLERPRYVKHHKNWVLKSLRHVIIHHKRYQSKFINTITESEGETLDMLETIQDRTNYFEQIENNDSFGYDFKQVKSLMDSHLTAPQKESVNNYLKNDSRHNDDLSKVHFYQSVRKLKDIVKKPKIVVKKQDGKKRGRKKGYKPKEGVKLGRKSSFDEKQISEIILACQSNDSLNVISKKFGVSNTAIRNLVKKHKIPYQIKKTNPYTLDELKVSAKNFESRFAWQKKFPGQYTKARVMGWLDECCSHMVKYKKIGV